MPEKEFFISLTDNDKIKIKFISRGKQIRYFVVQYYAKINGKWKTVIRADNSHGIAHLHTYHLHSKEYKVLLNKENGKAFNEAKSRVLKNYLKIKENYFNT